MEQCKVAWLTLDASDHEPVRFLAYLVTALQTVVPKFGAGLMAALLAPEEGAIMVGLVADAAAASPADEAAPAEPEAPAAAKPEA